MWVLLVVFAGNRCPEACHVVWSRIDQTWATEPDSQIRGPKPPYQMQCKHSAALHPDTWHEAGHVVAAAEQFHLRLAHLMREAISMQSACDRHAISMQSACNQQFHLRLAHGVQIEESHLERIVGRCYRRAVDEDGWDHRGPRWDLRAPR